MCSRGAHYDFCTQLVGSETDPVNIATGRLAVSYLIEKKKMKKKQPPTSQMIEKGFFFTLSKLHRRE